MRYLLFSLLSLIFLFQKGGCQRPAIESTKAVPVEDTAKGVKGKTSSGVNKQFRVRGDSLHLNKSVSSLCDELSSGVYTLLGEKRPERGFYPIHVLLYSKGNAKRQNIFKTTVTPIEGAGFKINLVVDIREQIDRSDLEAGVMQAIVTERTLRTDPVLNAESVVEVPRWVSDGLLGALKWKEGARNRGMFEVLTRKPDLFPVGKLLTTKQQDIQAMGETVRALYKASATAMVMSLARQKDGNVGLSKMLSEVAVFEGEPEELMRKHFPAMNVGKRGLQKLWNLQLAEMSVPRLIDTETLIKTEDKLRELLFLRFLGKDRVERRVAIKDFDVLAGMGQKERVRTTMMLRQELVQLSFRAYPDYQPILAEYGFILTSLARNEMGEVAVRLQKLAEERQIMYLKGQRARDVLDWYQLSQARDLKGDFTGYQRLLERMKRESETGEENGISSYVNQMQQLMTRGAK
ncbi:MAG: hypothetical protein ACI9E1_001580 [Cryomorphaceae bacterium]|jgi:hypothetical protein